MNRITIIYYTANVLPESFANKVRDVLVDAAGDKDVISVSQKPISLGRNICVGDIGRTHFNIYRQALIGAKEAKTKYIGFAEDDVLYAKEHFEHIPKENHFAYDLNFWSIFSFIRPPIFAYKDRVNMNSLICNRELFIETMEERFKKYPNPDDSIKHLWGEPGRQVIEAPLGVKVRNMEKFYGEQPSVVFYHPTALSYLHLGTRKGLSAIRAYEIPVWGRAENLINYYK